MSTALTSGSVVAGFRISRLIGKGAAGAVYLAEDADGRQVALKVPIPELAHDERFRQRFLREAQIAAALDEPHVVPTVAFGEADGMLYLAMVYVDGLDLREILRREGPLAPERAVDLIAQVAARPRRRARPRPRPPRREAGQRARGGDRGRRARLPVRLRPRQAHLLGLEPHRRSEPRRHHRLHLPRADRGGDDRRAGGRLLAGLHALRVPHRSGAVQPARASSRRSTPT